MKKLFGTAVTLLLVAGCSNKPAVYLDHTDKDFLEKEAIPAEIGETVRTVTPLPFDTLDKHYAYYRIKTGEYGTRKFAGKGFIIAETYEKSEQTADALKTALAPKGYGAFLYEQNYGIGAAKKPIAIVNTTDMYEILRFRGTNGINYNIDTDSLAGIIKRFDKKVGLDLTGAGNDWCSFNIRHMPADIKSFAREIYAVCPDVVDQGTGTPDALAVELEESKRLFLWWD